MQDLRCLLIERLGTDAATPTFGSDFETDTYIGQVYTESLADEAKADIMGLLQSYQANQLERLKEETIAYNGLNTLEEGEVIESIDAIQHAFTGDTILIRVTLSTVAGDQIKIDVPVDSFTYG